VAITVAQTATANSATNPGFTRSGSGVIRPNAIISANLYRNVILAEILIAIALWFTMPAIIPSPMRVYEAFVQLITEQGLLGELWSSLKLSLEAIGLSTVLSLSVAYAATIPIVRPIAVALSKLRFISMVGLTFVFTLYVGGGHPLKLAMLTFGMSVFFITSMLDIVLQVPTDNLDYVRTLRASPLRVVYEAQILGTLGTAFDVIRQNAAMGWLMLTFVEGMVRSEGGIGRLLLDQEKHFSLAAIFAVQLIFLSVGLGQDVAITWLKGIFAPWSTLSYSKDK
jgi:NitT/TauT family transport system permease protein